jgi:hypothetical protein
MTASQNRALITAVLILSILLLTSCSAGSEQFTPEDPAGFWYGLWHGIISVIALIVHIFADSVAVYEVDNTGGWYDFGFLLGILCVWGGSSHFCCKSEKEQKRDEEWEQIADKVETKVMRKMKEWAEDEEGGETDKEWDEIGDKVEKKLKRKIREWAEKE